MTSYIHCNNLGCFHTCRLIALFWNRDSNYYNVTFYSWCDSLSHGNVSKRTLVNTSHMRVNRSVIGQSSKLYFPGFHLARCHSCQLSRFVGLWIPSLFVCVCACVCCCSQLRCWATHDCWLANRVSWYWSAAPFILNCLLFIPCRIVFSQSLSLFSVLLSPVCCSRFQLWWMLHYGVTAGLWNHLLLRNFAILCGLCSP